MPATMRRRGPPSLSKLRLLVIPTALLFSSTFISLTTASTEFSFFEHSSCNAGTAFYQLTDPNPLITDLNCHQMPAGSIALYISDIDDGCLLRTYNTPNCNPSSLSGLLVNSGTCFYADAHEAVMLSWRADCAGVDYGDSNGEDHGNSYTSSSVSDDGSGASEGEDTAESALVASILATATGPVTVSVDAQNAITKTVVPVKETTTAASSVSGAVGDSSMMGSATATAASTMFSSVANDADRLFPRSGLGWGLGVELGMGLASSLGLVFAAAAFLV
ncbi:hypothetical protein LTR84_003124 [Exophiala bonariae]|uniref:Uncharacterized protein n=1 Tax=Exophiala bonariae TaxID=1690606 RepID=A0AAV9N833_9EURO|nr:hypothetical protein LTR84_003124 [Exophiala bonariae]